jgi:hypothetical protein
VPALAFCARFIFGQQRAEEISMRVIKNVGAQKEERCPEMNSLRQICRKKKSSVGKFGSDPE